MLHGRLYVFNNYMKSRVIAIKVCLIAGCNDYAKHKRLDLAEAVLVLMVRLVNARHDSSLQFTLTLDWSSSSY